MKRMYLALGICIGTIYSSFMFSFAISGLKEQIRNNQESTEFIISEVCNSGFNALDCK